MDMETRDPELMSLAGKRTRLWLVCRLQSWTSLIAISDGQERRIVRGPNEESIGIMMVYRDRYTAQRIADAAGVAILEFHT